GAGQLDHVGRGWRAVQARPDGGADLDADLPAGDAEAGVWPGLVADGDQVPGGRLHLFLDARDRHAAGLPGPTDRGLIAPISPHPEADDDTEEHDLPVV